MLLLPRPAHAENELSTFYHSDAEYARLASAAAATPSPKPDAVRKQRLLQYKEAVSEGWAQQDKLGKPVANHAITVTVLAEVERHAVPVPAAELERFRALKADLVDERKYYRLKAMA